MQCPVLLQRMGLRVCYAVSGTDVVCGRSGADCAGAAEREQQGGASEGVGERAAHW